jgi:glycine cleavage system transcriptional repressor
VNEIVVTAVGADRPGIVAAITGALLEIGGNLEETRAALLRGSFATVLAVAVPDGIGVAEVEAALHPIAGELGLGLWVGPAAPKAAAEPLSRSVVSVYGADRPGIVHGMAVALAAQGANIIDLSARLVGDPPIYVLGIEIEQPIDADAAALERALARVASAHGVELAIEVEDDEVM